MVCMGGDVTVYNYFLILVCPAWFAAAHTSETVINRWEGANGCIPNESSNAEAIAANHP